MKLFALVTKEGTACAETCLCEKHFNNRKASVVSAAKKSSGESVPVVDGRHNIDDLFRDVSDNDACECVYC